MWKPLHCRIKSPNYFYKSSSFSDEDRVHDKSQLQKILTYVGGWKNRQPLVLTRSLWNVRIFYLNSILTHLDFPSAKGKKINGGRVSQQMYLLPSTHLKRLVNKTQKYKENVTSRAGHLKTLSLTSSR